VTAQRLRRVALVCPYSWSCPGGVQTHVRGLARELRARGVETEILAPADGPATEPGFTAAGRSLPIQDNGSVQRVALSPTAVARTAAFVRARRFDLVHVQEPMIPAVCLTALLASPVPVVGTFHMCAPSPRWYTVFRPLCRAALERLAVRIAVSRAARDHVARACPGRYEIVPNGVEVPDGEPADPPHEQRIVFVGRPEPRKGLPVLLEALRRLPLARLDLIGPDDRDLTTTELPPDRITAHGRVSDDEKARLLRSAAVLCAPSLRSESFGLVIAEALAAGVPVVASDVAGYRELVRPDCGRLVPPGDPDALADAVRALLSDRQARVPASAAARKRAETLAWPRVADAVLELYDYACLSRRRPMPMTSAL
jgi:phosphatidyl-myo-inositol alpha-mannosyltransferase